MKIPITGSVTIIALLLLALAGGGCESTPLLAPSGASLTLLVSPDQAAPDANLDPTETYYFSNVYGQMLSSGSGTGDGGSTTAVTSTPLVGVSVTFNTTGGNLRFNACVQGVCSLNGAGCAGAADCVQPSPLPLTIDTDSAGVVQVKVAVSEDDPARISVTALSGTLQQTISFDNPLGVANGQPVAQITASPASPADASSGSVTVSFISESTDPDDDEITCYEWTVNSTIATPITVYGATWSVYSATYNQEQSLDVLLRVSDDPDAAANCNSQAAFSPNVDTLAGYLVCTNTEPVASFFVTSEDNQASTYVVTLDGSASSDPDGLGIKRYQWNCKNGQEPTGVEATCTYTKTSVVQNKQIELVVSDNSYEDGCELDSEPAVQTVTIPALGTK